MRQGRPDDAARAEKLLRDVVAARADDVEAWLDLAAVLERTDAGAALAAYGTALPLLAGAGGG